MPLKLLSPRTTGRRYWYIRGVLFGRRYFESTKATDRQEAEKYKDEFEKQIKEEHAGKSSRLNFAYAAQKYIEHRNGLSGRDKWLVRRIVDEIGHLLLDDIVTATIKDAANKLYPDVLAASKNRSVIRPAAAVLHYAAKNKWCSYSKIEAFKEPAPKTRSITPQQEKALHAGLRHPDTFRRVEKRLLLLWLVYQGPRISDALDASYEHLDLNRMVIRCHISKSDRYAELPLDERIGRYLRRKKVNEGPIFPWASRFGVRAWLDKLKKLTGIHFTPHMGRHTLGKRLNDAGAGLRTIMQALGQTDPKSAMRYQTTDVETIRLAKKRMQ